MIVDKETMRSTLLAFGWTETIYGTFQTPGSPWHSTPWRIEKAYARVTARKTCGDCGLCPIPRLEVVYVGGAIMCRKCALQAPKEITVYVDGTGKWWWNDSGGGRPTKYVRADLVGAKA
jgi:hypothetical protein